MSTDSRTWFYTTPEPRPYFIEERVNHTLWKNRLANLYMVCTQASAPIKMEGRWQNEMPVTFEWVPGQYFILRTGEESKEIIGVMRQVLIDHVRGRERIKRGGDAVAITLGDDVDGAGVDQLPLLALDQALNHLQSFDSRLAELTELHVFAGLEFAEIAQLLDSSERSVYRDWRLARVFLRKAMAVGEA